jgi:4-hydroxybenzoate polyprenyltransferase
MFTALVRLARPHQYVKNGFVFLPVLFGHRLADSSALYLSALVFVTFCLLASAVYTINDIRDREEDREHPQNRLRPLASGELTTREAVLFVLTLVVAVVVVSILFLPSAIWTIFGVYLGINLLYSFYLRKVAIVDLFCLSSGFVLRVLAGAVAADVWVSHWLIIMTFLLSLFLALAKRRNDLVLMESNQVQGNNRRSLAGYNLEFVSMSMVTASSVIIVAYILYTVSPETLALHGAANLYITSVWVILGLMRYMQITFVLKKTLPPTLVLLKDRFMQITVFAWVFNVYILLYWR